MAKGKNILEKAKKSIVDVGEKGGEAVKGFFSDDEANDHKHTHKKASSGKTKKHKK